MEITKNTNTPIPSGGIKSVLRQTAGMQTTKYLNLLRSCFIYALETVWSQYIPIFFFKRSICFHLTLPSRLFNCLLIRFRFDVYAASTKTTICACAPVRLFTIGQIPSRANSLYTKAKLTMSGAQ